MGTEKEKSGIQKMIERWQKYILWETLEIFRFEDEVFSRILKKQSPQKALLFVFFFFSPKKSSLLSLLREVKPSPDRKIIKPLTFDTLSHQYNILAKTRSKMTMAFMFSGQSDSYSQSISSQNLKLSIIRKFGTQHMDNL